MPTMVTTLKTITEAILHLLLQIFVHQLEKQENAIEVDSEPDVMTQSQLLEMMQQIQVQKTASDALKDEVINQKRSPERVERLGNKASGPSASAGSAMKNHPVPSIPLNQRRNPAPSITSQAASWQEIEEVEEIVAQESLTAIVQPMPTSRGGVPPAPTLPLPGNLTLAEWGTNVIKFGRKHKGKTYASVMQQDPNYLQWSLARYGSLMIPCTPVFKVHLNTKGFGCLKFYANTHSPLTEAVGRLGYWAIRFTKQDGDLATFAGRHKLWSWIEKYQPEHIWMAPECGPWGGWNHLNKLNFCATYCRGFAEMMARNLCKAYHTHVGDDERALAFHSDDVEERPSKRLKINPQSRKRHQTESETPGESISARPSVPMSDVPTPNVGDPNPNQTDAQPVQLEMPQSEPWQKVFELAQDIAPNWQHQMSHGFRGMDKSPNHCPRSYADHRHVRLQRHRKIPSSTPCTKFSSMSSAPHCVYA